MFYKLWTIQVESTASQISEVLELYALRSPLYAERCTLKLNAPSYTLKGKGY